ncbi:MAG: isoleucyl-tRNA synthetase [Candidatus Woesearchaeota archaeon]|jgi:isoleucyl-tRNA synthetase
MTDEKIPSFNPLDFEPKMIQFWQKNQIIESLRESMKGKKKFYFLQGPPYTSGRFHLGHAWNVALKDMVLRYKRMTGHDVWDRAGYDMHGLPTENKVMAKFDLKYNHDIEKFGLDKFIIECGKFANEMMGFMNEDIHRLGVTMDTTDPYRPSEPEFIEGVWKLIKKVEGQGRLYKGKKTMHWCVPFQTALAKHELEYQEITDQSMYVKFPVTGEENTFFVIWTTTPWTLVLNLAVMVNPEVTYVKVQSDTEYYIIAKDLIESVSKVSKKEFVIVDEFLGETLKGKSYTHPWIEKVPALKELTTQGLENLHTVLLSKEHVDTSSGTGLVHCAPGCGPEDYEVGHLNHLPPFNTVKEDGTFDDESGFATGKLAKTDDAFFIKVMKEDGYLLGQQTVVHDYPHCERSHTPIIFRTTEQWFFKVEDIKEKMVAFNEKVNWVPEKAKNAFRSWLENLRDNSITKQRFWGTPAPIWVCDKTGKYVVIESRQDLRDRGATVPENLHKPFIDEVTFPSEDGGTYRRIPDVLDVWLDAGSASWNCLYYAKRDDLVKRFFPADFILEGKDQVRGWFNLLMVTGTIMFDEESFKNCYMHGMVTDVDGVKMSKSLGNIISPEKIYGKYGVDTLRYYFSKARPGEDINFSWEEVKVHYRNVSILYNTASYVLDLISQHNITPEQLSLDQYELDAEEKYILSYIESNVDRMTKHFEKYELFAIADCFEKPMHELSRTYIQYIREKLEDEKKRPMVIATLYQSVLRLITVAHPTIPFATEHIYQLFKARLQCKELAAPSISHHTWPTVIASRIDTSLEEAFSVVANATQGILAAREKAGYGVRWPLQTARIVTRKESVKEAVRELDYLIKAQTNVRELVTLEKSDDITYSLKPYGKGIGETFGDQTQQVMKAIMSADKDTITALVHTIQQNESYTVGEFAITDKHVQISESVSEGFTIANVGSITTVLDATLSEELELEGFAREFSRRIQVIRKDAGLQKNDSISITVKADDKLVRALQTHQQTIKARCGIVELRFGETTGDSGKIKDQQFVVSHTHV